MSDSRAIYFVKRALPKIMKRAMQDASVAISGYVGANMATRAVSTAYKSGASDTPFANATNRNPAKGEGTLRVASGRLYKSFVKGKEGNVFEIETTEDGMTTLRIGSTVPYAAIHEYGGTIANPGGTPYMIVDGGRVLFLKKGDPRAIGSTKAHSITMPARPYLGPALARFEKEALGTIQENIANALMAAYMNGMTGKKGDASYE